MHISYIYIYKFTYQCKYHKSFCDMVSFAGIMILPAGQIAIWRGLAPSPAGGSWTEETEGICRKIRRNLLCHRFRRQRCAECWLQLGFKPWHQVMVPHPCLIPDGTSGCFKGAACDDQGGPIDCSFGVPEDQSISTDLGAWRVWPLAERLVKKLMSA